MRRPHKLDTKLVGFPHESEQGCMLNVRACMGKGPQGRTDNTSKIIAVILSANAPALFLLLSSLQVPPPPRHILRRPLGREATPVRKPTLHSFTWNSRHVDLLSGHLCVAVPLDCKPAAPAGV